MKLIKFTATPEQIRLIGSHAASASKPVGMGFMHYKPGIIPPDMFKLPTDEFHLDYVQGRMVKLHIWKRGDHWEMRDETDPEYQSWCDEYQTATDLLRSVSGVDVLEETK